MRAVVFFDGQNLFNAVKVAFGYSFPNYDPILLAKAVCEREGWELIEVRFYTGIPDIVRDEKRHNFWKHKLSVLGRTGTIVRTRPLAYSSDVPREKGIDVRLAIDVIVGAIENRFDIAVIFSQDQDFSEVAHEIRRIAKSTERWIKIVSAFPVSDQYLNKHGINRTDWIPFDRTFYDACRDHRDYR